MTVLHPMVVPNTSHSGADRSRQAGIVPDLGSRGALLLGLGATGFSTAHLLGRLGVGSLWLQDDDYVSESNVTAQGYPRPAIGRRKVITAAASMEGYGVSVRTSTDRWVQGTDIGTEWGNRDAAFLCIDNRQGRVAFIESVLKKRLPYQFGRIIDQRIEENVATIVSLRPEDYDLYSIALASMRLSPEAHAVCETRTAAQIPVLSAAVALDEYLLWISDPDCPSAEIRIVFTPTAFRRTEMGSKLALTPEDQQPATARGWGAV